MPQKQKTLVQFKLGADLRIHSLSQIKFPSPRNIINVHFATLYLAISVWVAYM